MSANRLTSPTSTTNRSAVRSEMPVAWDMLTPFGRVFGVRSMRPMSLSVPNTEHPRAVRAENSGPSSGEGIVQESTRLSQAGLDLGQLAEVHHFEEQVIEVGLECDQLVVAPSDPGTRAVGRSPVASDPGARRCGRLGLATPLLPGVRALLARCRRGAPAPAAAPQVARQAHEGPLLVDQRPADRPFMSLRLPLVDDILGIRVRVVLEDLPDESRLPLVPVSSHSGRHVCVSRSMGCVDQFPECNLGISTEYTIPGGREEVFP